MKSFIAYGELPYYYQLQSIESTVSDLAFKIAFLAGNEFETDTFYRQLMSFQRRLVFHLGKR